MRTYFIGIYKKSKTTIVLQAVSNKDYLSCETWQYYGERENTKANLRKNKYLLLSEINKSYKTDFKHLVIE